MYKIAFWGAVLVAEIWLFPWLGYVMKITTAWYGLSFLITAVMTFVVTWALALSSLFGYMEKQH